MRDEEQSPPDAAEAPAAKQSIGETLRATREFRRASIEYVAELLRIEPRFLVALEEDRFTAIGPPVFVKGYLKHYAELLGLDPNPLLDELRDRLGREEPPLQARRSAEQGGERSSHAAVRFGAAAVVLAAVAVAAAVGVWQLGGLDFGREAGAESDGAVVDAPTPTPARAPGGEADGPRPSAAANGAREVPLQLPRPMPISASLAGDDAGASDSSGQVQSDGVVGAVAAARSAEDASAVGGVLAVPASTAVGRPAGASGGAESELATAEQLTESDAGIEIELRFIEDSWTEVTSSGGERLFYGLGRAGVEERIRTNDEVRVLLGNAKGVVVSVNGEPFAYPAGSRSGDLARFRLSPEN